MEWLDRRREKRALARERKVKEVGYLSDSSVAWEFAHKEEAERIVAERDRKVAELRQIEEDYKTIMAQSPGQSGSRYAAVGHQRFDRDEHESAWFGSSFFETPCTAVSPAENNTYAVCRLEQDHHGPHERHLDGVTKTRPAWVDHVNPHPPIVVYKNLVIEGPEDLANLRRKFKADERKLKRRFKEITSKVAPYFD